MDACLGFYFICVVPGRRGRPVEVDDGPGFAEASARFEATLHAFLGGRPDLLDAVGCFDNGLEVRLHCGHGFYDEDRQEYFYGRVDPGPDQVTLELATDQVLHGGAEALDVVVHELTHVLDLLDEIPGVLPFWEAAEDYLRLRDLEVEKLHDGASVLDPYALRDAEEFLAVAVETWFARPELFRVGCPDMALLFDAYFRRA